MEEINYLGELELRRAGKTMITVEQQPKRGINAVGSASYELTILPRKPILSFANGEFLRCSTVSGTCANPVSNIESKYADQLTYYTSNPNVATVDNAGIVKTISSGESIITAKLAAIENVYQSSEASYTLTVIDYPTPIITWNKCGGVQCHSSTGCICFNSCYIELGPQVFSAKTNIPEGGVINYESSDVTVASVDPNSGLVTPLKNGVTYLKATQQEIAGVNTNATVLMKLTVTNRP
jgi:hypothetical protein